MSELLASRYLLVAGLFLGTLLLSGAAAATVLIRLPTDYFVNPRRRSPVGNAHPLLRAALLVAKNAMGWILIVIGLFLSFPGVPGQGLLTMFVGLLLVDFPGKYRLERRMLRFRRFGRAVNWIRRRFGRPPLELPDRRDAGAES
ncbi:MAG: hypothetical protein HY716_01445 [Planctomycetes bacterium]|nr:hypothetical protein [Planctomycetota bacterium]